MDIDRPLRILILTNDYPNAANPPAAMFIHRRVLGLQKLGMSPRVVRFQSAGRRGLRKLASRDWWKSLVSSRNGPEVFDGVAPTVIPFFRSAGADEDIVPLMTEPLIRWFQNHPEHRDVDIIFAHWLWPAGAVALRLRDAFGWPVAAIALGGEMHHWQRRQPRCRDYVIEVLQKADLLMACCDFLRLTGDEHLPGAAAQTHVIYEGCDANVFRPASPEEKAQARARFGLDPNARWLMFCGGLDRRKGIPQLASAWPKFASAFPDWRLLVVGPILEKDTYIQLQAAAGDRMTYLGRRDEKEVAACYHAADAFILPSLLEGLANVTCEALACELPTISTDTSGQKELIQHGVNGWLIPVNDPDAIVNALCELAADLPKAQLMAKAGRLTILERFHPVREQEKQARLLRETVERVRTNSENH